MKSAIHLFVVNREVPSMVFVKDEKLDNLILRYSKDKFYANYDKENIFQNKFTKKALNFELDLTECDSLLVRYNKKRALWVNLEFFNPGIKGLIAFFYEIEKGYNTVWIEQYDYPDAYFYIKAFSDKDSDVFVIEIEDHIYDGAPTQRYIVNKKNTINNFKKVVRKAVSKKILLGQPREDFNYYIFSKFVSGDDLELIDNYIEKWNFIRSLRWLFDKPQKKLVVEDFLTVKNFNDYKRLKLKFAWDKEAEQKKQQDREVYGMAYDDYKGMVDNLLTDDTTFGEKEIEE